MRKNVVLQYKEENKLLNVCVFTVRLMFLEETTRAFIFCLKLLFSISDYLAMSLTL